MSKQEQVSEAAEQLAQNNAAEAPTAGRRAEREFEQMRDEFRQNAAGQFNEAVREFQQEVERLSAQQEEISQRMAGDPGTSEDTGLRGDGDDRGELSENLREQAEDLGILLEKMQETVEQAEESSRCLLNDFMILYRETKQRQTERKLEEAANLLERGFQPQAEELNATLAKVLSR